MSQVFTGGDDNETAELVKVTGSTLARASALPVSPGSMASLATVINAQSVAASGNTGNVSMGLDGTESEVWVIINTDQQPWTLRTGVAWLVTQNDDSTCFPKLSAVATAYSTTPAVALCLFTIAKAAATGLTAPTTMAEARQLLLPSKSGVQMRLENASASTMTATVQVLRVWKGSTV